VLEGPYARRKIFTLIGLYSPKGPDWANMGRSLVRGMLNSARGISDKDTSAQAQAARRISGFADLDGLEFVAKIDIGTDTNGEEKNEIRAAVTPDHKEYAALMGVVGIVAPTQPQAQPSQSSMPQSQHRWRARARPGHSEGHAMLLRPRQKQFVERSVRALGEHGNTLGVAPTGAGKTIMLSG